MSSFAVKYGNDSLSFSIPESTETEILAPMDMPPLADPAVAVVNAVERPSGCEPLSRVLDGGSDLVVVVSDKTRVTGADIFLPVILDEANRSGIPDESITVLFALGTHSAQTEEERRKIVGPVAARRVRLVDHGHEDLVDVGTTSSGTPVFVNRLAHNADRLVITGTVQLHYFAGFGGGRKGVLPGICGEETIVRNHSFTVSPEGGRNPLCATARLDGNPLHEDMAEAAALVEPDFLVNTVMNGKREISAVFAGHWEKAHVKACEYVASHQCVTIRKRADIVVACPGGYPKDINYIQSHKAYDNAFQAVKPGGTVILTAECREGLGNDIIREYLSIEDLYEHESRLRNSFQISGHTALAHRLKASAVRTIMVTGMSEKEFALLGVERACDVEEAVRMSKAEYRSVYIMPEGSTTLPCCSGTTL